MNITINGKSFTDADSAITRILEEAIEEARDEAKEEGKDEAREELQGELESAQDKVAELEARVAELEGGGS